MKSNTVVYFLVFRPRVGDHHPPLEADQNLKITRWRGTDFCSGPPALRLFPSSRIGLNTRSHNASNVDLARLTSFEPMIVIIFVILRYMGGDVCYVPLCEPPPLYTWTCLILTHKLPLNTRLDVHHHSSTGRPVTHQLIVPHNRLVEIAMTKSIQGNFSKRSK